MKKVFTLILALALGFGLKAQTGLTQAVDFTATDCHGQQIHLFDILDGGQAVLIDFFYTTCGPCQQATPKIAESYTIMGCNQHDVYFMEITPYDADAACLTWVNNYGIEYPTIGTTGGGSSIISQYGIGAFPTVILIMPDHSIVIQDLWPISNAQTIVTQLGQHGLQPHDCNTVVTYDPQVTIDIDDVTENTITATYTPNGDCASYYYLVATEAQIIQWVTMGADFQQIIEEHGGVATTTMTYTATELTPDTEYKVLALPVDPDGNYGDVVQETVTTLLPIIYEETLTLSEDTLYFHEGMMDGVMLLVTNNTAESEVTITGLELEAVDGYHYDYYYFVYDGEEYGDDCNIVIPQGGGVELRVYLAQIVKSDPCLTRLIFHNTLEDVSVIASNDIVQSINEDSQILSLFPNPANENVTLKGENLGTVRVYNMLGQMLDEFEANGNELNINTTGYENGVYVVKAGEQTLRFVVKH